MPETIQQTRPRSYATHEVKRRSFGIHIDGMRFVLPLILLLEASVSILTLHNSAFQDEALYLLAGRQIVRSWFGGPPVLDPYSAYFSGYPNFYPVIGGVLDMLGGLELARMFSLLCMLTVTACAYFITKRLFNKSSAIFAAVLFACQGPVLFLDRLATYDALCLCMLALATAVAVRASQSPRSWSVLAIGPLLLLAVAAKYAGLLFVPAVLAILVWSSLRQQGWKKMFLNVALAALSLIGVSVLAYWKMDRSVLVGLSATTTQRVAHISTPTSILLEHVFTLGGVAYALAIAGFIILLRNLKTLSIRFPDLGLGLLLYGASLLAPIYHIYKGELVSLDKHMAFSIFFIMPLAGYALSTLSGYWSGRTVRRVSQGIGRPGRYWLAGLSLCLVMFMIGVQQAQIDYNGWANSSSLTYFLHTQVYPNSGRYLAEDYDVERYSMQDVTSSWQWSSLDFYQYTNKQHQLLVGPPAYKAAIDDGYFDLVELSYGYDAATAQLVFQDIRTSGRYDLIARIIYYNEYGKGYFWIWRKHIK